jgi:hypothetical protein
MPLAFHTHFAFFIFKVARPKPHKNLRAKAAGSLRRILPLRGGEGWGEGERNLFPTGTEIAFNQPFPKN